MAEETDSPSDTAFRPCHRLLQAQDFKAVFGHRHVLHGCFLDLHLRPNGGGTARIGFVVAKRLARHAVQRNLIKRLGREAFRRARAGLPAMDMVLRLCRPISATSPGRAALRADIENLLERVPK